MDLNLQSLNPETWALPFDHSTSLCTLILFVFSTYDHNFVNFLSGFDNGIAISFDNDFTKNDECC